MATTEQLVIEIQADLSDMRRQLGGLDSSIASSGSTGSKSFGMMTTGVKAFGLAVAGAALGAGAIGAVLGKQGIAYNASMEQYQSTLETVLKSQTKAVETMQWAKKFAATTPFEMGSIVEATVRLKAYGLEAEKVLPAIGDMAAVMGKDVMQAVEAVADAQTGELERLKEFGITKKQIIEQGKKMGLGDFVDTKGTITDLTKFNGALEGLMKDRFAGGMDKQAKTFNGQMSNLKDTLNSFVGELSKPLFEMIKNILPKVIDFVTDLSKAFEKGGIKGVFDELLPKPVMNFLEKSFKAIQTAFEWLKSFWKKDGDTIKKQASGIFETIGKVIKMVVDIVKQYMPIFLSNIKYVFDKLRPIVEPIMRDLFAIISDTVSRITHFWNAHGEMIMQALTNVFNTIKSVIDFVMPYIEKVISIVWKTIKGVFEGTLQVIFGIVQGFAALFTGNWSKLGEAIQRIWYALWKIVGSVLTGAFELIKTAFNSVIGFIKGIWTGFVEILKTAWNTSWNAVTTRFTTAKTAITGAFTSFIENVKSAWNSFTGGLSKLWTGMWTGIGNAVSGAWGWIKEKVTGFINSFVTGFNVIVNKIKEVGGNIVRGLWQGIVDMKDWIIGKAKAFVGDIVNGMKERLKIFSPSRVLRDEVGKMIGLGLAEGLDKSQKEVTGSANSMVDGVLKPFDSLNGQIANMGVNIGMNKASMDSALESANATATMQMRAAAEQKSTVEVILSGFNGIADKVEARVMGKVNAIVGGVAR